MNEEGAPRYLERVIEGRVEGVVTVAVLRCYVPVYEPGHDFKCMYEVRIGDTLARSRTVYGIDAIQAVLLALRSLATEASSVFRRTSFQYDAVWLDDLVALKPGVRRT